MDEVYKSLKWKAVSDRFESTHNPYRKKSFIFFGLLMINEFPKKVYQQRIDFVSSMLKVVI